MKFLLLEFLDEVVYEDKSYKIFHNLYTLDFDLKKIYLNSKKVTFLSNDYVLNEDGIY